MKRKWILLLLSLLLLLTACFSKDIKKELPNLGDQETNAPEQEKLQDTVQTPLSSKEEVAAYLHEKGRLPDNFITKKEAEKLGWKASQGNLWEVAPGKSIGGDSFGNREGLLPDKKGRKWYECDIDYQGGNRGAQRIVYSNDGLIYYTADHYKSFEEIIIP